MIAKALFEILLFSFMGAAFKLRLCQTCLKALFPTTHL